METPTQVTWDTTVNYSYKDFHSDYICPECGGLLYIEVKDGFDICVNPNCKHFPAGVEFSDPSKDGAPRLHSELETTHAGLVHKVRECASTPLALYGYIKRKALIAFALRSGVIPSIPDFLALGELLIMLKANPPKGKKRNQQFFQEILQQMKRRTEYFNFVDDMENGRLFVWLSEPDKVKIFMLKYLSVIRDGRKSYGITSGLPEATNLFEFHDVQELVDKGAQLDPGAGYIDFLDSLWPYTLTLGDAISTNYRISKQYNYYPEEDDIAALLGWYFSFTDDETQIIPIQQLQCLFERYSQGTKSFDKFLNKYAGGVSRVPIVVKFKDNVIADRQTLLYFTLYLHGQYRASGAGQREGEGIARQKQQADETFEHNLRERMSQHDYKGPKESIRGKFNYDVIMLSEAAKRIVLADVEFRDLSPSPKSGHTWLQQELVEQGQGLLAKAERQLKRLEYFMQEPERFRKYLNPQADWKEYEVRAYLLTRNTPLIDRYGEVRIISAYDFLGSEL